MTDVIIATRLRRPTRKLADYERRILYGDMPGFVDSAPITAHLRELHDVLGLPLTSIARDAGCSLACVKQVYGGHRPQMQYRYAAALRSVTHIPNERQEYVLGIGAVRRLQALRALAWPLRPLAEAAGIGHGELGRLTTRPPRVMPWERWHRIHVLYECFSGTPGEGGKGEKYAAPHHWPMPLDWEGFDMDDHRVIVEASRSPKPLTTQELSDLRALEVQDLTAGGRSIAQIADRMRISERQVIRLRRKAVASH